MSYSRILAGIVLLATLAACGVGEPRYRVISRAALGLEGVPDAEQILIMKSRRKLYLLNDGKAFRSYDIGLGFAPTGAKTREGDGRTPEGSYLIDRRNPKSAFYLSLGISYPDASDRAAAALRGEDPGSDIFLHGEAKRNADPNSPDWTAGCISVSNREIEEIWVLVRNGTSIVIQP